MGTLDITPVTVQGVTAEEIGQARETLSRLRRVVNAYWLQTESYGERAILDAAGQTLGAAWSILHGLEHQVVMGEIEAHRRHQPELPF